MDAAKNLELFDACIENRALFYQGTQRIERRKVDGLELEFRISTALQNKPGVPGAPSVDGLVVSPSHQEAEKSQSDINVQGLQVSDLGDGHILCFNKFAVFRPHYLILTRDASRRQWEQLSLDDFRAVHDLFARDSSDHLIFYNCRAEAGCSRLHKHLQAIPKESFGGNPWVNIDRSVAIEIEPLPFTFTHQKHEKPPTAQENYESYQQALKYMEKAFRLKTTDDGVAPPHNVIMDRQRMIVIPRRVDGIGGVGVNACGMLGIIYTQKQEIMDTWLELGPRKILEAAGIRR